MNKEKMNKEEMVTNNGRTSDALPNFWNAKIKDAIAQEAVQKILRQCVDVPKEVTAKEVRKSYKPDGADAATQKIKVMSGTSIQDAVSFELTLVGIELDPVKAVNKKYRIVDYTLGLEANMSGGRFGGYAATGFKLMVTRLEEVKEGGK